jgi:hypothetical protein
MISMEDTKEYAEMVLNDIGDQYNIDIAELTDKYLCDSDDDINDEKEDNVPVIKFTLMMKNGEKFFRDQFGNIYNEKFNYIEKEEKDRKRAKKPKKNKK